MSNITASAPALLPNALGAVGSFLFWWGLYVLTTYCFARWSATKELWSTMTPVQRYSLATCVHSSVHGIIVPVGMFVSLSTCGLWGDFLSGSGLGGGNGSCREAEFVFSWTVGYFLMDGILLLIYRGELWQVFIVHHFVGIMPFFVNCFFYPNLQWAIGGGILIELANPFLNLRTWLDLFGLHNSDRAAYACYLTFAVWVPVRCALPTYLLWGIVNVSVPAFGNEPGWIVTTYITGWAIGVFCYCGESSRTSINRGRRVRVCVCASVLYWYKMRRNCKVSFVIVVIVVASGED